MQMQEVYVLQNGNQNQYKIGVTENWRKRVKELQTGCPYELKLVKLFQDIDESGQKNKYKTLEKMFHQYFKEKRIRSGGEWFELDENDINYINSIKTNDAYTIIMNYLIRPKKRKKGLDKS